MNDYNLKFELMETSKENKNKFKLSEKSKKQEYDAFMEYEEKIAPIYLEDFIRRTKIINDFSNNVIRQYILPNSNIPIAERPLFKYIKEYCEKNKIRILSISANTIGYKLETNMSKDEDTIKQLLKSCAKKCKYVEIEKIIIKAKKEALNGNNKMNVYFDKFLSCIKDDIISYLKNKNFKIKVKTLVGVIKEGVEVSW